MNLLGLFSVALFFHTTTYADLLFSPWNRWDAATLRRKLDTYGDSSTQSQLERAEYWQALAVLETENGHPHASHAAWKHVEQLCQGWRANQYNAYSGKIRGRAIALCALAGAEHTAQGLPYLHWGASKNLRADVQDFLLGDLEEAERLHATGRLRAGLSPFFGLDFKTALLSWRVLERQTPTAIATDYWTAVTLERQGNQAAAAEAMEKALKSSPPDVRAVARAERKDFRSLEALDFGWAPTVSSTPARGVGLGLRFWDDRIADQGHAVGVAVHGTLRRALWGNFQFTESEWTAPLRLRLSANAHSRLRDYFGLGMTSPATAVQEFNAVSWESEWAISFPLGYLDTAVSVLARNYTSDALPAGLAVQPAQGFAAQVVWDNRDRTIAPRSGLYLLGRAEWLAPTASPVLRTRLVLAKHFRLALRHTVHAHAALSTASGTAAFNQLSDLEGTGAPGIREMRWVDANAAAAWLQYRYLALPWLRLGVFGTWGAVAASVAGLPSSGRWGAGIEAQLLFERTPRFAPTWELGVFNQEWIFQGGIRVEL